MLDAATFQPSSTSAMAPKEGASRRDARGQSALSAHLLAGRGQVHWTALRSDHCIDGSQGQQGLPATPATHQVLRCRTRQTPGLSNQQFRLASADYRSAISLQMAGRIILQMDQAASSNQAVLWHHRECSQDSNMDRHHRLRPGCHRKKATQYRGFAIYHPTDFKSHSFRENTTRSIA